VIYLSQFTYHFGEAELQGMELFRKKVMDYGLLDLEI
jgi:predicted solute-binding protein